MTAHLTARHALAIVEQSPFPLLVMDRHLRVLGCNRALADMLGDALADQMRGRSRDELYGHPVRALLDGDASVCWTNPEGECRQFAVARIALEDGAQAHWYIDLSRQLELERANSELGERLRQNILTDSVTGLLNRRGLMLALEPQVARSRRYNSPIAVVMLDVACSQDSDVVRLHVARLLKDQLRWADLIGYSDHDEFMLILPETMPEAAARLAEKLVQRVRAMSQSELDGLALTARYGVTGWRRSDNAESLLERAAAALRQARGAEDNRAAAL